MSLTKKNKLGEGAYGIVYEAEMDDENGVKQTVAVKRNFGDIENKGISCVRELNFLASFNHPCITKLKTVSVGDPFKRECPMTPKPKRNEMQEDSHHFILEYSNNCLEDYYETNENLKHMKIIIVQMLLGVEFMHAKHVLHRDLKPGNILVTEEKSLPYAKICDFGLSCVPNKYRPSTPGTVTSWYRAPEICCEYDDYSFPSDIWSVGCIIYEIITKKPFIYCKKDSSKSIFKYIVSILPQKLKTQDVTNFIKKGDCSRFKHGYSEDLTPQKKSFLEHMKEFVEIEDFNESAGSIEDFCDLLDSIFILNPEKRFTATQCLNHKFFNGYRKYINDMREKYPPVKPKVDKIEILDCLERRWSSNILIKIYNNRSNIEWYSDHLIFHTLRLYDEYLVYCYKSEKITKREIAEKGIGKLHTEEENSLKLYITLYVVYKYLSTLYKLYTWDEIFPKHLCLEGNIAKIEEFEKFLLKEIVNYTVFNPTFLEYLSDDYTVKNEKLRDLDIRNFFMNYCNLNMDYSGTMEDLYNQVKTGI
jgi:serine/threonine protein kinase